jgi:hypothetical protein
VKCLCYRIPLPDEDEDDEEELEKEEEEKKKLSPNLNVTGSPNQVPIPLSKFCGLYYKNILMIVSGDHK